MVRTKYLSEAEKAIGQKRLYQAELWNGIGFSMLGDTIVYILAVHFGAGNIALGYIASAMYIVGFALPLLPRVFQNRNVVRVQAITWFIRGFVCLCYLPLLWMTGGKAVFLLLAVYTLFCCARLIGVVLYDYTFKAITTNRTRGRVIGNVNVISQSSTIVAKFLNFVITSIEQFAGVFGLIMLQMLGVVCNTIASHHLLHIPCRTPIEYRKGRTIIVLFKEAMHDRDSRIRLFVYWTYMTITVIMGMSVAFLTKEVGLPANLIFLYTMVVSVAVIFSGSFCKFFSDRLGSRPLIIWNAFAFSATLLGWIAVPVSSPVYVFFLLGFLMNFFLGVVNILIKRLVASAIPDEEGVGFNSMVNFVIAFLALFGGLAGGALASAGINIPHEAHLGSVVLGNSYLFTFLLAMILSVVGVILSSKLTEKGSYSSRAAAQIMFSLHGIRAFLDIERLGKVKDPFKRKTLLLSLGANLAGVATSEIKRELAKPFSEDKQEIIRGLFNRMRPSLVDDLVRDAFDADSYTQIDSIFALGALTHNEKAERALVFLLEHGTNVVRSTAAESLARVTRDARYLPRVISISDQAATIEEELNFLVARNIMDTEGMLFEDLFLASKKGKSATFRQTRYSVLAKFLNLSPPLADLYGQKNLNEEDYLAEFIDEARDVVEIEQQKGHILNAFEHREWSRIWAICFLMTQNLSFRDSKYRHLYQAIIEAQTMPRAQTDGDDALAVLYFSYHLKKNSE